MIKVPRSLMFIKYLAESLLPMLFWILLTFGFDKPHIAILTISAAILHELGHVTATLLTRVRIGSIQSKLNGLKIKLFRPEGYFNTILIVLSGPLANLLIGAALLISASDEYIKLFGEINLLTAVSNLMPIEGYDGYRVLCELGASVGNFSLASMMKYLSFSFTIVVTFFSLYLLLRLGVGYWLFAVFFTSLISKTAEGVKSEEKISI